MTLWLIITLVIIILLYFIRMAFRKVKLQQQQLKQTINNLSTQHQLEIQQKNNFLATASHDLQQPHQALGLFLSAINSDTLCQHNLSAINKAKDAHEATARLLNHLLDLSHLDNMSQEPSLEVIPLHDFIHDLGMRFMPLAAEHHIELRIRLQEAYALSNATMLERILNNIILNAIHHAQGSAILLAIRQHTTAGEKQWCLEVYDNGKGIAQDKQKLIFQEFTQLDQTENQGKNLGLGLAIVQRLSLILKHPIILRSRLGHGSCFSLHLPASIASASHPRLQHEVDSSLPQDLHVAIVINNAMIRESLTQLIMSWGCRVHAFSSSVQMLQHHQSTALQTKALIIDDNQIIAQVAAQNMNVILITQDIHTAYAQEAKRLGFHLLSDPINPRLLKKRLSHQ